MVREPASVYSSVKSRGGIESEVNVAEHSARSVPTTNRDRTCSFVNARTLGTHRASRGGGDKNTCILKYIGGTGVHGRNERQPRLDDHGYHDGRVFTTGSVVLRRLTVKIREDP